MKNEQIEPINSHFLQKEITFADVVDAKERISPYALETPVIFSDRLNKLLGAKVYFKCEMHQRTGAYKVRGALNTILSLTS